MSSIIPFSEPKELQIRWLIRRDLRSVLDIEKDCFEFPWSEEDFLTCLRQRNCIGMVAEQNDEIVGFMIYDLQKSRLRILNFAVAADRRRQGVGHRMITRLVDKLSQQRRNEILLEVRETNLDAQLFFKSQDFRAVGVIRNRYDETDEDAYSMQYVLRAEMDEQSPFSPKNRISDVKAA
ncbi:ribosomal protein S18-alanine N-acetyltransferase [Calycomorphotria hydatis]|uniref:Ribosomal-protein-alanine N-acetyltransferase n=1 Tax=Calycomorphotria hydatis TaxID=2528027 RepID=A0A517T9C1_9PLAN|nr:ribosomal protein S18-alanine N-acetyltransferase [Calycomorphotria hydatis]QDT64958.1 ribosomal-protein-alanine N-acetyltransferase [Calycomorphotria hydatis]